MQKHKALHQGAASQSLISTTITTSPTPTSCPTPQDLALWQGWKPEFLCPLRAQDRMWRGKGALQIPCNSYGISTNSSFKSRGWGSIPGHLS